MSKIGHNFPPIDQVPIPEDARPDRSWTEQMLEMAAHIAPYHVLRIVERFGGQQVYISADPARNVFRDLIGASAAATLSHVYRRERLEIPTAKGALFRARRRRLIAQVRANEVTVSEAARMLGTSRTYLSHLVNQTTEGSDDEELVCPRQRDPGQMDLFGENDEA